MRAPIPCGFEHLVALARRRRRPCAAPPSLAWPPPEPTPLALQVAAKLQLSPEDVDALVRLPETMLVDDSDVGSLPERAELLVYMRAAPVKVGAK